MNSLVNRVILPACAGILTIGCATTDSTPRPFSENWADVYDSEQTLQRRREYIKGDDPIILYGRKDGTRAAIVPDERGRPRLDIGKERGFSADFKYRSGVRGRVKYKYKWDFSKPQTLRRRNAQ